MYLMNLNIKNIIFDFGGVLYDIDINRTISAFEKIGIKTKPWQPDQDNIFNLIETGKLSSKEIVYLFKTYSNQNPSDAEILDAFNKVLIGLNLKSLNFLLKLKSNYRLFMLSNTNIIHFNKFSKEILNNPSTNMFFSCFEKDYYSYKIGIRKPDIEIFEYVIADAGINSEETVFVDDTRENLINPSKLGIHTFWMKNTDQWDELINHYQLKIST